MDNSNIDFSGLLFGDVETCFKPDFLRTRGVETGIIAHEIVDEMADVYKKCIMYKEALEVIANTFDAYNCREIASDVLRDA